MTQEGLGVLISKTKQAVSLYCNGKTRPSKSVLAEMAKVLNVSEEYLTGLTDVIPSPIADYRWRYEGKDIKTIRKKYYEKNKDRINAQYKEWLKNNSDKKRAYEKKWRHKNPEKEAIYKDRYCSKKVFNAISKLEYSDNWFSDKILISVKEVSEIIGIDVVSAGWLAKQNWFEVVRVSDRYIVIIVESFKLWLKDQIEKNKTKGE